MKMCRWATLSGCPSRHREESLGKIWLYKHNHVVGSTAAHPDDVMRILADSVRAALSTCGAAPKVRCDLGFTAAYFAGGDHHLMADGSRRVDGARNARWRPLPSMQSPGYWCTGCADPASASSERRRPGRSGHSKFRNHRPRFCPRSFVSSLPTTRCSSSAVAGAGQLERGVRTLRGKTVSQRALHRDRRRIPSHSRCSRP